MKKFHYWSALALSILLSVTACSDDANDPVEPGAGIDESALENLATYDFEVDELDLDFFKPHRYSGGKDASVCFDEAKGVVMYLNNGYVTIPNPFKNVKNANVLSLCFWMKQDIQKEGELENAKDLPQDLEGALFTFENDNASGELYLTANGTLSYKGVDGEWADNEYSNIKTDYLSPAGEWHYVVLSINDNGYALYVDGDEKENKIVDDFDFSKIISFLQGVSTLHIGYRSGIATKPWKVDDICFYRNRLTEDIITRPGMQPDDKLDSLSLFDYITESPISVVGAQNYSSVWGEEFSNYYRIPENGNIQLRFINHTDGKDNENNWGVCITNDKARNETGYVQYFVLKSNLEGSGDYFNKNNISHIGYEDWNQFRTDMNGAEVVLDINRHASQISVTATAKSKDGKKYIEQYSVNCGEAGQVMRASLTVNGSYLEINTNKCRAYRPAVINTPVVGNTDNSSGWSQAYSDYFTMAPESNLQLEFTNYTCGAGNWNNWNLYISTDADRGNIRFIDYMLLRSDLYGWGISYDGSRWINSGYGNWDQFRKDMQGANVVIDINRNRERVTYTSLATADNGNVYMESTWGNCGEGNKNLRCFLCVDGSHFEMIPSGCYNYVSLYK